MTERAPRVPARTCVGCGQRAPKHELLRLVAGADGLVLVDAAGIAPGRGAHVHRSVECVRNAASPRAVGRAFRGKARSPGEQVLLGQARMVAELAAQAGESTIPARSGRLTVQRPSD